METELRPLWKDLPQLPLSERDRRWEKIREKMALAGIDCLLLWNTRRSEHIRYVTQLQIRGAVLFPLKGEPIAFTIMLHIGGYAKACQNWIADIRDDIREVPKVIKDLGLARGTIGIVTVSNLPSRMGGEGLPARTQAMLHGTLPEAKFVDATSILEDLEMIKSPHEIEFLRKSAEISYNIFDAIRNAFRPGATECEVYAAMLAAQTATGGDVDSIYLDIGSPPMLHGRLPPYTTRKVQKGDMLITEYHASYAGYLVAAEHTFALGEPHEEIRKVHRVGEECFKQGTASMVIGAQFKDVIAAYRAPADREGIAYVELGIHGHGLSSCEFPTTVYGGAGGIYHNHNLGQIPPVTLQENMVFGHNIDLHNPVWNPNTGIMLGDTIWVTKEGPNKLTSIPLELTVL
jgi:Xaa-Pro aminopeptidase